MRGLNLKRLWDEGVWNEERRHMRQRTFCESLVTGPLAAHTDAANQQHYEVPSAFFELVLGPHLKYSCCLFSRGNETLQDAEEAMLRLTCQRAGIADGQRILELGCGWGSLSLWMAQQYPRARIVALSNSATQKSFIDARAAARGITNLEVITQDIVRFTGAGLFDRVVSVEMFEHMRNYELLLARIRSWLEPNGRLFVHYFCHHDIAYPFETLGEQDWMARYFFTGGIMPSFPMLSLFPHLFIIDQQWWVDGTHYEKTSNAWLKNLDRSRMRAGDIFHVGYGANEATLWIQRWRMFFMAVAELFGTNRGRTWGVGHYVLRPA
jgi:cyclopropane-fatty-acyl-phospholipid synthase